jgi:maltose alpha-D-glucosyltransferase/alpha-amylase
MAFHFPLMPRMFMALRQEDRHPIVEILRQTPDIPESCQWGLFLRNHDELTLEMVTDEERDYMYQAYASDPQMRINGGIRRRLAPLMENSRRRIELMNSLLFSLPGTPVIYYGDEIGMGDNIYLGDRNSVRTPMQWTGDRNAGFSRADGARLYAPLITDPVYGYAAVNVEAQERSPFSLLNWMKRMIALRKQHAVFGRGTIEFLPVRNRKVLAFTRQYQDETVLCIANLSRSVQPAELDLARFRGLVPVEMLGQTEFPRIGDQPYFLSLGAYGFNWFRLQQSPLAITERTSPEAGAVAHDVPTLMVGTVWDTMLDGTVRTLIERDALVPFLMRQPWFQGPRPRSAKFKDWGVPRRGREPLFVGMIEVEFDEPSVEGAGPPRLYFLPLSAASAETAKLVEDRFPHAVVARISGARKGLLFDASHDERLTGVLADGIGTDRAIPTRYGSLHGTGAPIADGRQIMLKAFRRLEPGIHPEVEVTRHLVDAGFTHVAPVVATIDYERRGDSCCTAAMIQQHVESQADGWTHAMDALGRFFDQAASRELPAARPEITRLAALSHTDPAADVMGGYLEVAGLMGKRTAEAHVALATDGGSPAFTAEPMGSDDLTLAIRRATAHTERTLGALANWGWTKTSGDVLARAHMLVDARDTLMRDLESVAALDAPGSKIRIHGDYRLGQVLVSEGDLFIQNLEGHLSWPAAAQREKLSPLRDVASMLRSFSYVSHAALLTRVATRPDDSGNLEAWARVWRTWAAAAFLHSYLATAGTSAILPPDPPQRDRLLRFFMLDRALRELDGELNNRPEWVGIPTSGILELLEIE